MQVYARFVLTFAESCVYLQNILNKYRIKMIIKKTILSVRAKNLLLYNVMIKRKIAEAVGKTEGTIHRWIQEDDTLITQADAMRVIRDQTGLEDCDLLTQVEVNAAA
jgi:hypothetical protein